MQTATQIRRLRPLHILVCCAALLVVLAGIYLSQNVKLSQIAQEQQALQAKYETMLLEEQRLNGMLSYVHSDDYLMQYAREKLGYVGPNDYKFYRDTK